ncbi:MAG TPA: hypothetical protein VJ953_22645 [Saprospiraceae bacterium]|nr:hypothetical protein [Saprospiraceae bacterium]
MNYLKRIQLLTFLLFLAGTIYAQQVNMEHMGDIKPRNIGPAGMSGRVTAIDVDLSDSDIIYAGTASGGVWKSTNGGVKWEPIFDDQPVISIGAVTINQQNPSEIWVGTGEGNPRNSHNSGGGIYKSLDGGRTWEMMGLEKTINIHRIIVHEDDPDVVYVGALGSIWGDNPERGVYRTTDGGETWELILEANASTGVADMVVDPSNPNKIIAALWEFGRKPWTFNSGGEGSGLFITYDGGDTWTEKNQKNGLPKGPLGRIGLAFAPSKPNIVYALVEAKENALYKSMDGGNTWSKVTADEGIGNRPFYYSDIFVDPQNENRLYSLFSLVNISEDGGRNWRTLLPYSGVHPDHHAWWIHPEDPGYMIDGNDGGLNITRDGGKTWRFVSNLPLAQFYHINYDMDIPYNVAGGMQDNGSWIGPAYLWQDGGIRNHEWQEIYFGDGFDVVFRPDNNRYAYAMSQQGRVGMVDRETGYTKRIVPTHPDDSMTLRFNWNAAIAQDPFNDCGLYFGSQFVHYSTDCGDSWEVLSPDLTTNDTAKQKQGESGGLTIDATGAENFTTIVAIAPSPADEEVIWVGTDDGNLQLTQDKGKTWTNLASRLKGAKPGSWIPYIEVSPENAGEAFIVVNDYRRNDFTPMVFHTNDFGKTFTNIVNTDQVRGYAESIVQDPEEPNLLFLGTDNGLYISIDGAKNWTRWTNGYPAASTIDMKIHPREHDLIIGTFGRAAWILDDIRPLRAMAANPEIVEEEVALFDTPDAYLAEYKSYDGFHFPGDGIYVGENRRSGAMLTVWRKPATEDMDKQEEETDEEAPTTPKDGEAKFHVINSAGDTIRTFSNKLDTGMNRIYWSLNRNGVEYPSRRDRRPDADPPGGPSVLPGTYTIALEFGDFSDETEVTVKADPRLSFTMEQMRAKDAAYRDFEQMVEKATAGFDQLKEVRKTMKRVSAAIETLDEEAQKETKDKMKALGKEVDRLEMLYMMPDGLKGIQRSSDNLSSTLRSARGYISSSDGAPNQGAQRAITKAKKDTQKVLEQINTFMTGDFKAFQEHIEELDFSLFKNFEPIQMNR